MIDLLNVQKPARYTNHELNSIHKDWDSCDLKIALVFPDLYEIGISNLGLQIFYGLLNSQEGILAERAYCPAPDYEEQLTTNNSQLTTLESKHPLSEFDMLAFSLAYELSFTNILTILHLAGIPLRAKDRTDEHPLIFAGGHSTFNPEPVREFFDFFVIGEGEEVLLEIAEVVKNELRVTNYDKTKGGVGIVTRNSLLVALAKLEGVYVPGVSQTVKRRMVKDLDWVYFPTKPIVPFVEGVHDRAVVEIMRGCPRTCKFCQAGRITRPVRLRRPETVIKLARELIKNTGYDELSLISLSSSDYPYLKQVTEILAREFGPQKVSLSLPSLRADSLSFEIACDIASVRPTTITLAPEAGTQRLRDVLDKKLSEEEILEGAEMAFSRGSGNLKLYFMLGLPTETEEDIKGIVDLCYKILAVSQKHKGRANLNVSAATFIPKPMTAFEREGMLGLSEIKAKQQYLKNNLKHRKIKLSCHSAEQSVLEGVFARGDSRLCDVIEAAWRAGARLDGWNEYFKFETWLKAFEECGVDYTQYLAAKAVNEKVPWSYVNL